MISIFLFFFKSRFLALLPRQCSTTELAENLILSQYFAILITRTNQSDLEFYQTKLVSISWHILDKWIVIENLSTSWASLKDWPGLQVFLSFLWGSRSFPSFQAELIKYVRRPQISNRNHLASYKQYISHVMRKPVYTICEQQRHRSAQSDQHLCSLTR